MGYREYNTRSSLRTKTHESLLDSNSGACRSESGKYLSGLGQLQVPLYCHRMLLCRNKSSESQNIRFFKGSQKSRFKCEFSILKMLLKFLLLKHLGGQKTVSICHQIKFCTILIVPVSLIRTVEKARGITVEETS